ncbi:MAG: ATP-grasp domain-containing protein [Candidatus Thermoplasmatota archaeon]
MGLHSKYASATVTYPNPLTSPDAFLNFLVKHVQRNNYDCIIPIHTYTFFLLTKHRKLFESYTKIPPPKFEVFYKAYDKQQLNRVAAAHNIPIPRTYKSEPLEQLRTKILQYPVVVKPAQHHTVGIAICHSFDELQVAYRQFNIAYGACIIQDYIPNGGEYGVYTLFNDKLMPVALTVQQRLRTLNKYGGVSTLRQTVVYDELVDIAFRLLKHLQWSGVAMVEFRIDKRDGTPKVIEINPRFWGSLQLSIFAGVDFPYLLYRLVTGEDVLSNLEYAKGIRCRWFLGDIIGFWHSRNKRRELRSFLDPTIYSDDLTIDDPKPLLSMRLGILRGLKR